MFFSICSTFSFRQGGQPVAAESLGCQLGDVEPLARPEEGPDIQQGSHLEDERAAHCQKRALAVPVPRRSGDIDFLKTYFFVLPGQGLEVTCKRSVCMALAEQGNPADDLGQEITDQWGRAVGMLVGFCVWQQPGGEQVNLDKPGNLRRADRFRGWRRVGFQGNLEPEWSRSDAGYPQQAEPAPVTADSQVAGQGHGPDSSGQAFVAAAHQHQVGGKSSVWGNPEGEIANRSMEDERRGAGADFSGKAGFGRTGRSRAPGQQKTVATHPQATLFTFCVRRDTGQSSQRQAKNTAPQGIGHSRQGHRINGPERKSVLGKGEFWLHRQLFHGTKNRKR